MDDYPGIEIRCVSPEGLTYFRASSGELHFDLSAAWLHAGYPPDTWHAIMGGNFVLEVRAVNVPALPSAPDYPADLFRGVPGELGQLAALERAAAGRADERAAAAGLEPRADVDQAPEPEYCGATPDGRTWPVCSLELGHAPPTHESADFYWSPGDSEPTVKGYRPGNVAAAAAAPPGGLEVSTAAATELGPASTEPTRPELSRLAAAGARIARTARRARFLLGRSSRR